MKIDPKLLAPQQLAFHVALAFSARHTRRAHCLGNNAVPPFNPLLLRPFDNLHLVPFLIYSFCFETTTSLLFLASYRSIAMLNSLEPQIYEMHRYTDMAPFSGIFSSSGSIT